MTEKIEKYRDQKWRREENLRISTSNEVERMVLDLGFCLTLTDARTPLPSVYIAVCGRRDVHTPKNVQKDEECSIAWVLKDEVLRNGNVFYSKLVKGRAMFIAPNLLPYFKAVYGVKRTKERQMLSINSRKVLGVLRREGESSTADLRADTKISKRQDLTKALEELQRCMKILPYDVLYKPKFTYLWTLTEERFPNEMATRISRKVAVKELARTFLEMQGITAPGDFARAFGIKRTEAGQANQSLVEEGFAVRISNGVYAISELA
ncbi:MAG: DNA glycosylase AlkZ-like family protein [Pyrinomonadaceae bacterium]